MTAGEGLGDVRRGRAIATICLGVFLLVVNDALAKWLTTHYDPLQIVFLRNLVALPLIAVIALATKGLPALRSRTLRVHAWRGLLLVAGAYSFFVGLKHLPLAEATALIFAAPIFITALSVPLLREQVGWRRWAAVIAGFIGVLIIVRPGAAAFQPASLFVVATAAFYALFMIGACWIDGGESFWTMMLYLAAFPLLFSAVVVPLVWQMPSWSHLPLFLGMAVFGTLGMALITQVFRQAPVSVVAPFDYTALLWASLFGWLLWNEIPGVWTYVGAAVIVAGGIYIVAREARRERD